MATHWYELRMMIGVEDRDMTGEEADAIQTELERAIDIAIPDVSQTDAPSLNRRLVMNRAERRKAERQR